ncbi:MAG: 16S rRNA processing protein RimM [Anaerolineales bacterium]|nr:16S rRNA processing protein RimM [Anaerolineales bacterium]
MKSKNRDSSESHARQPPEYLAVGRVVRPHGVRGGFRVSALSDLIRSINPATQVFFGPEKENGIVSAFRAHGSDFLLFIEGCDDRTTAERWRGQVFYIRFEETEPLPDGVYYYWQIIGLEVFTLEDERLGEVEEILETGANDVYIVRDASGKECLIPAIESVIVEVDLEKSRMVVNLIPGLLQ